MCKNIIKSTLLTLIIGHSRKLSKCCVTTAKNNYFLDTNMSLFLKYLYMFKVVSIVTDKQKSIIKMP